MHMIRRYIVFIAFVLSLLLPCYSTVVADEKDETVTMSVLRLSVDVAIKLARASIKTCREENVNIAVTVVDRAGHPQVVLRDTLAMDLALQISKQKAYTAMSFNTPTSQLIDRFRGAYSVPKQDSLIISAGGVPIVGGGAIIGGVGVSGAPSGLTDEKCAQAGVDAVRFELESIE